MIYKFRNGGVMKLQTAWSKIAVPAGFNFITKFSEKLPKIKEALLADRYSSKKYTFDQAYKDARSKGQKTFFWDGKYYNTDYEGSHGKQYKEDVASGKAQAWEQQYPEFTNPELRKEKQEEIDTYGITNEQTRNKSVIDKNLLKNLPITTTNYVYKGLGKYTDAALSALGINLRKYRDYKKYNDEAIKFNKNHITQLGIYLGFPLSKDLSNSPGAPVRISEFKPTIGNNNVEYYYTLKEDPFGEPIYTLDEINNEYRNKKYYYPDYSEIYKKEPLEEDFYYPLKDTGAADYKPYMDNNKSYLVGSSGDKGGFGTFTISNTPKYRSFYDLWDFSTNLGTPYSYYDRHYYNNKPNIDDLYLNFTKKKQ